MNKLQELLSNRLGWSAEAPQEPIGPWPGASTREGYCAAFARKDGSFVEGMEDLADLDVFFEGCTDVRELDIKEVGSAYMPGHTYYRAQVPEEARAWQDIRILNQLPREQLPDVRVVLGPHGYEFQLPGLEPQRVDFIHAMADGDGLVTWYPGDLTQSVKINLATVKAAH